MNLALIADPGRSSSSTPLRTGRVQWIASTHRDALSLIGLLGSKNALREKCAGALHDP